MRNNLINNEKELEITIIKHISNNAKKIAEQLEKKKEEINGPRVLKQQVKNVFFDVLNELQLNITDVDGNIYFFNSLYWMPVPRQSLLNVTKTIIFTFFYNEFNNYQSDGRLVNTIVSMIEEATPNRILREPESTYINMIDGVWDVVRKQRISRSSERYFFSYCLPYYGKNVFNDTQPKCPNFNKFLDDVCFEDDKSEQYIENKKHILLSFMCYSILNYSINLEKALILYGTGANGKSTFINIWQRLIGESSYSVSNVLGQDNYNSFLLRMEGKLVNFSSESSFKGKENANLLKSLISKEPHEARDLYEKTRLVKKIPLLVFSTNSKISFSEDTAAIQRRFVVVEFTNRFDCSIDIIKTIDGEYEDIFKLVLSYANQLLSKGYLKGNIYGEEANAFIRSTINDSVIEYILEEGSKIISYHQENRFERVDLSKIHKVSTYSSMSDIGYISYVDFCRESAYKPISLTSFVQSFSRENLGLRIKKVISKKKAYIYVSLEDFKKMYENLLNLYNYKLDLSEDKNGNKMYIAGTNGVIDIIKNDDDVLNF